MRSPDDTKDRNSLLVLYRCRFLIRKRGAFDHIAWGIKEIRGGDENRTRVTSLEDWGFTTKLHPQKINYTKCSKPAVAAFGARESGCA